jgi:tetratricopeptide (TPR) repeat protein
MTRTLPSILALPLLFCLLLPSTAQAKQDDQLRQAEQQLQAGNPKAALALVEKTLQKHNPSGAALLVAGTAHIMLGDTRRGEEDLRRALSLDPTLKQGWLNLAAVEIASVRYTAAYDALIKAQELDPQDMENQLNLGAVSALDGKKELAANHFARYLQAIPDAQSHYLVAGNYALGGFESLAVEQLRKAIDLDEKYRLKMRSDNKFILLESSAYLALLNTDSYRPPAGAHSAAAGFKASYSRQDGVLINAVLEAMQDLSEPYDPRIEATEQWTLIWGAMRIKISNQSNGTAVIRMSAPVSLCDRNEWQKRTQTLFQAIHGILNRPRLRLPG